MPYDADIQKDGAFLWVGLDGLNKEESKTLSIALELHKTGGHFGFKVNNDWLLKRGVGEALRPLPARPVFADTKMWNGAGTMARSFVVLHRAGFSATNAYALAGGSYEGAGSELKEAISSFQKEVGKGPRMRVYALTILTHYNGVYSRRMFKSELPRMVTYLAGEGLRAGADGIIVPGSTLSHLFRFGKNTKVIPGIRCSGEFNGGKHAHTVVPEELAGRTDIEAVCGSPIMDSDDPVAAMKRTLDALR